MTLAEGESCAGQSHEHSGLGSGAADFRFTSREPEIGSLEKEVVKI